MGYERALLNRNTNEIKSKQLSIMVDSDMAISNISYYFYADNNCSNQISQVNIDGYTTLLSGSYTTTSAASVLLMNWFDTRLD